jgi:hypothetical protein
MMSTCSSKHVVAWNKYIKKECVKLAINQNAILMLLKTNFYSEVSSAALFFQLCKNNYNYFQFNSALMN